MMTWLIAAGGTMHIVAGGLEAFMLVLHGDPGFGAMLAQSGLPVLIGISSAGRPCLRCSLMLR